MIWGVTFGNRIRKQVPDGAASNRSFSAIKSLKAQEIETELTSVSGDEALQISAVKK
jgi:hypothetical protein